ncbi:MAG: Xaa-Pro peptidase family protein [Candidatus Micrarchaeota archaeon]|nr:Xaa-Pro peptidase family protein [Candidatus Micrarchaeota archaeon]
MLLAEIRKRRNELFEKTNIKTAVFFCGHKEGANFEYFCGCRIDGSYLVLKPRSGTVLTHEMNYRMAKAIAPYRVECIRKGEVAKIIRKACGNRKIGFCPNEFSVAHYKRLKKSSINLVDFQEAVSRQRASKSDYEIKTMAKAAKIARDILESLDPWEYKNEKEIANALKIMALQMDSEAAFEPIVATDKNSSFPHHLPTEKKIGEIVLVDFGVKKDGYCSDLTRCYVKSKNSKEWQDYEKCQEIFWEIYDGLQECTQAKEIAELSELKLKEAGFPPLVHAIGHGVGLEVHEAPHLGKASNEKLRIGNVISLEPAAYKAKYGVRFEEMVVFQKRGWKIV